MLPEKQRHTPVAIDSKKSILRRTAWNTTILVVPFFLLSNSLPFPIKVKTWQVSTDDDEDELWGDMLLQSQSEHDTNDDSSDEDVSYATPSIRWNRTTPDDIHLSTGSSSEDHYSENDVAVGQTLKLSGVTLREPLFMQVSQRINAPKQVNQLLWTNPLRIDLPKMKTGINPRGVQKLSKLVLDLGDSCDCLVDVSLEGARVPTCTIYSPYW